MSENPAGDPDRDVRGGVVVRRELFEQLNRAGRVTEVSGPAGSGKSVLLRSWIHEAALAEHAALVSVQDEDRDPRRFWTSAADALRDTAAGSAPVRPLTAAPDLDGWSAVEQLLADLGSLRDRIDAKVQVSAPRWRRCGSPRTARERRSARSRPSSTARPQQTIRCG